ncbi:MAG: NUDIX hydrolase N-terminal domain-containing protein [Bacilli bacterium]|jgi:8-oxo-dGTP diphosphatase|nr:NUDIX hydrolase N-terminal domain-containing protein [Bacillota bacterium]HOA11417.1 NUDIX hydrolase N-terminal domain-containing protein [Bacilli bacterium]HOM32016.1 NUDIX hydrolase N-terminal domain-containing protein [Bacilli bacterium]HPK28986.1 NUDIX hydrolase N-terminal domain-containing protein [Bacilli bacterium]
MDSKNLYDFLIKVQSIAKIGLLYTTDPYAKKNYIEIGQMTLSLLEDLQAVNLERNNYFKRDIYPTPNISVRAIIFNKEGQLLMVQEKEDGGFSLPGGWADLYDSPTEAILKETTEEAGAKIKIMGIVAFLHRTPFKTPTSVPEYVLVFKAEFVEFIGEHDHEILTVKWVDPYNLPPLSHKVTKHEVERMINAALHDKTIFD